MYFDVFFSVDSVSMTRSFKHSRAESNAMLLDVVALFRQANAQWQLVEPAHMEIAQPDILTSFRALVRRCNVFVCVWCDVRSRFVFQVARGAKLILIHPFFLLPGRHWSADIPRLADEASRACDNVRYLVTAPLATHALMARVMQSRIETCLAAADGRGDACDVCTKEGRAKCQYSGGGVRDIEELSVSAEAAAPASFQ